MEALEQRRVELVKIITAYESLFKSEEWATLKELIFDKNVERIERLILSEATAKEINLNKIYNLQGQLENEKRYGPHFIENLKKQLEDINNKIK